MLNEAIVCEFEIAPTISLDVGHLLRQLAKTSNKYRRRSLANFSPRNGFKSLEIVTFDLLTRKDARLNWGFYWKLFVI